MLKVVVVIAIVLAIAVVAFLAYASTKPGTFMVKRSATILAPPETIFPLIDDYKNWPLWSPYENRDPAMKRTYGGAPRGVGAKYAWEGNRNVGSGHMEIMDASPPNRVVIKLDFLKPFEGHNVAEFTLLPQGAATTVTWAMHGPVPFIGKIMHTVMDMDKMIGTDFADGLAKMKTVAEARAPRDSNHKERS